MLGKGPFLVGYLLHENMNGVFITWEHEYAKTHFLVLCRFCVGAGSGKCISMVCRYTRKRGGVKKRWYLLSLQDPTVVKRRWTEERVVERKGKKRRSRNTDEWNHKNGQVWKHHLIWKQWVATIGKRKKQIRTNLLAWQHSKRKSSLKKATVP